MFWFLPVNNFGNRDLLLMERTNEKKFAFPFAGITLFRFYGYNLSLR